MTNSNSTVEMNMTKDVVFMRPSELLSVAYGLMKNIGCRHLPIVEGEKLIAILSDRDILLLSTTDSIGNIVVPEVPVSEAMTLHPITCREGTRIAEVASVFLDRKIDSLAVVDKNKALVGMITSSDLLELLCDEDDSNCARVIPFKFRSFHHEEWTKTASSAE